MVNIKILCLDQSTKVTGYSIFQDKELISYGVLKSDPNEGNPVERIKQMNDKIIELTESSNPNFVVFEQVQFQNNYGTFQQLSQLQGVIMAHLFKRDVGFIMVEPSAWRSICGIKGRKRAEQKRNTQIFVKKKYKIDVSEDEADAIGIGTWAINKIKYKI
ncbi:MAG TPA: crossover junction endodeoxyribonuclease RuvC [Acholeplasma sp.]|nr:crossover junction endodeoxyribonuclease RuvC [Acholeplasma sp.]